MEMDTAAGGGPGGVGEGRIRRGVSWMQGQGIRPYPGGRGGGCRGGRWKLRRSVGHQPHVATRPAAALSMTPAQPTRVSVGR
ncbi:hypothetical protein I4F81_012497 [Pyropia yezoensis]|uniref:Uncharacterized protein n=1 Tax=Pyropia yezoensis TaxID=2788 RepID=A0ACC3CID0_PYRYE|nr:hypothetical protein I4F81_012497 [Neopyropia yezoensis]